MKNKRIIIIAAIVAVAVIIILLLLNTRSDFDLKLSDGVTVRYTNNPPAIEGAGCLVALTEEELFAPYFEGMEVVTFEGEVVKVESIVISFGVGRTWKNYRAIAHIEVSDVFRGDIEVGSIVEILLPTLVGPKDYSSASSVTSQMTVGTKGIFMPAKYNENSTWWTNNRTLYIQEIAEYGLLDGERWAFLETERGLIFSREIYTGISEATTMDEVRQYVNLMLKQEFQFPNNEPVIVPATDLVVGHSFPAGSPQAEYIEQIALPEVVKEHPGITASTVYIDKNEIFDIIYRLFTEGNPPDIIFWDVFAMEALCNSVADLNGEPSLTDLVGDAFYQKPNSEPYRTIDGKWLGIPVNMDVQVLLYNPELTAASGLAAPATLNEFWSAIETITTDSNGKTAGFVVPTAGLWDLAPFVLSEGGELWNDDGKTVGYLDSGKNEKIFEELADAVDKKQIIFAEWDKDAFNNAPALTPEMGIISSYSDFVNGKAAMTVAFTNELNLLSELYPDFKFETAPFPAGSAGSVSMCESQFVSVLLTSPKSELSSSEPIPPQPPVSDLATAPMSEAATFIKSITASADIIESFPKFPVPEPSLISVQPLPLFSSYLFDEIDGGILSTFKEITAGKRTTKDILSELAIEWDKRLF